jgi:hypothetical protein
VFVRSAPVRSGLLRCWPGRLAQARLGLLPFAPDLWKLVQPALAQPGFVLLALAQPALAQPGLVLLARLGRVLVWNRTMMIGSKETTGNRMQFLMNS